MQDDSLAPSVDPTPRDGQAPVSVRSPAAERALAEAAERRRYEAGALPPETGGRGGPEPVRYGDWEKNGIVSDF